MNLAGASFDSLPPIDLPFRYFISGILFPIALAAFIFFSGEAPWSSRWHPTMLAITHGFTLGFIGCVMMGALLQILPVVGGISFIKVRLVASYSHIFHIIGTVSLLLAFLVPNTFFDISALLFLSLGFILYIGSALWAIFKTKSKSATISAIRLAISLLVLTVILGLLMQLSALGVNTLGTGLAFSKKFTNIHTLWGLFGWVSLLIMAVSFQIIPMFHVAPNFPNWLTKYLPSTIAFSLILLLTTTLNEQLHYWLVGLLLILQCIYVVNLLKVINQRKRKIPDTTINYWQLAALSLLLLTLCYFLPMQYFSNSFYQNILVPKQGLLFAAVFIYFYIVSILQGMLLKILPFLSYTHLQQRCLMNFSAMQFLPNMHEMLTKKSARLLFILHCLTGISLLITILYPVFHWLLASLLFIEFSFLLVISIKVIRKYQNCATKITDHNPICAINKI